MNIIITSIIIAIFLILITNIIGNSIMEHIFPDAPLPAELFGLIAYLAVLFIFGFIMLTLQVNLNSFYFIYLILTLMFILIFYRKLKFKYNLKDLIWLVILILFSIIISSKFRLGEQFGDNTYLTNMVTMNINSKYLNTIGFGKWFKFWNSNYWC